MRRSTTAGSFDDPGAREISSLLGRDVVDGAQALTDPDHDYSRVWMALPDAARDLDPLPRMQSIVDDLDVVDHGGLRFPGRLRRFEDDCRAAASRDVDRLVEQLLLLLAELARRARRRDLQP